MDIKKEMNTSKVTLSLKGWLDTQTAPALKAELDSLESNITELEINCAELEYISSAGIRQLVAAHTKMNGNLALSNVSAEVMSVLKMTGINNVLKIK
ncbi:MAG: STAS domain-containing protein [Eubacterium sp.]|nr:STAS domain-containing protein [Eubacterium sp.]